MSKITPKNETPVSMFFLENVVFNPLVELLNSKGWTWKRGLTEACKLLVESHSGEGIILADEQARRNLLERKKAMEPAPPPPMTADEKQEKAREQMREGAKVRYGKGIAPLILGSARWDLPPHPAPWELSPGCDPQTMTEEQMIDLTLQAMADIEAARKRGETVDIKFVAHDDFENMHPCYAGKAKPAPAKPAPIEWEDPKVTARKLATEQEMAQVREMHARAAQKKDWC